MVTFENVLYEMNELYKERNSEYGNSFSNLYEEIGPVGAISQMYHKMSRLVNDCKSGKIKEDSLIDLANYTVMMLVEVRNRKRFCVPLPYLRSNGGQQLYLTQIGIEWRACQKNPTLQQSWKEVSEIPEEYRKYAVIANEC